MKRTVIQTAFLPFFILLFTTYEEACAVPPQRGFLSSSGNVSYGDLSVPEPFEGEISGGVSLSDEECRYQVTNTSKEDTLRFSVEVNGFTIDRKRGVSRSYSHKLAPGESDGSTVRMPARTAGCTLYVTRWRSEKKKEPLPEATVDPDDNGDSGTQIPGEGVGGWSGEGGTAQQPG